MSIKRTLLPYPRVNKFPISVHLSTRARHDASELIKKATHFVPGKVDQGTADDFLREQLKPEMLAAKTNNCPLELNLHEGYDHSYYFISSFIEEHLRFHANHLSK